MMKQEIPLSGMTEKSESSVPKKKERTGKEDWYDPAIREEEQPGTHILLKNILLLIFPDNTWSRTDNSGQSGRPDTQEKGLDLIVKEPENNTTHLQIE